MKKIIFIFFSLLISFLSFAQSGNKEEKYIDSLRSVQIHGTTDSIKARASFILSDKYSDDFEKGKKELDAGLQFSKGNRFLKGLYHFYYGQLYFYKEPENAISEYRKSIDILKDFTSTESYETQARAWHNLGAQHDYLGDPQTFMEILIQHSLPLAIKAKNDKLQASYNYAIGMMLMNNKDHKEATAYYRKSIALHKNLINGNELGYLETLLGMANNFLFQEKTDSARYYLDIAMPLADNNKNDELYINFKEIETNYYDVEKKYAKAEQVAKETLEIVKQTGNVRQNYQLTALYFQLFKALLHQSKYLEAKTILESLKPVLSATPGNRRMYYSHMAELHEMMKDFPVAYDWLNKAYIIRDSLYNSDFRKEMILMDKKLKLSEKEKQIAILEADKKENTLFLENQKLLNWLLGIGAVVFLLAFILAVYIYSNRQQRTLLKLQEEEQKKEHELTKAILEGEERERQRMGRDLHDGLGGALSGIKIKLSGVQHRTISPVINEMVGQLDNAIGELRRIAQNMMPETLIRSGLQVALSDLCVSLSSEKTFIELQTNGIRKEITLQSQLNIYRITQELIANAIHHGKATKIIVQCLQTSNHLLLTVEDNGEGFDPKQKLSSNGIGLNNILNRVHLLKGKISIDSILKEGTTVNIELYGPA